MSKKRSRFTDDLMKIIVDQANDAGEIKNPLSLLENESGCNKFDILLHLTKLESIGKITIRRTGPDAQGVKSILISKESAPATQIVELVAEEVIPVTTLRPSIYTRNVMAVFADYDNIARQPYPISFAKLQEVVRDEYGPIIICDVYLSQRSHSSDIVQMLNALDWQVVECGRPHKDKDNVDYKMRKRASVLLELGMPNVVILSQDRDFLDLANLGRSLGGAVYFFDFQKHKARITGTDKMPQLFDSPKRSRFSEAAQNYSMGIQGTRAEEREMHAFFNDIIDKLIARDPDCQEPAGPATLKDYLKTTDLLDTWKGVFTIQDVSESLVVLINAQVLTREGEVKYQKYVCNKVLALAQ